MSSSNDLKNDFDDAVSEHGEMVRFRFFSQALAGAGSSFDDNMNLVQSGTDLWLPGMPQPVNKRGIDSSSVGVKQERGRDQMADTFLFVTGSLTFDENIPFKVNIGSGTVNEHSLLPGGANTWPVAGVNIYNKLSLRFLPGGSLSGE